VAWSLLQWHADRRSSYQIQTETDKKKALCVAKGWKVFRRKNGEEVKLRHVLEKISVWLQASVKVVDAAVSSDQSAHVAVPWACVKFLITVGHQLHPPTDVPSAMLLRCGHK
jgi:hypothetical protein